MLPEQYHRDNETNMPSFFLLLARSDVQFLRYYCIIFLQGISQRGDFLALPKRTPPKRETEKETRVRETGREKKKRYRQTERSSFGTYSLVSTVPIEELNFSCVIKKMSSRVTDTNTTSPALVADDSFVHHQSPYDDANHNRRFLGLPPPHSPPAAVEDIHRGSLINFYNSVHDPHLLASWASFFRDQYLMTNCELHKAKFLHTVEKDILSCSSLEAVFRGNPFVGSKVRGIFSFRVCVCVCVCLCVISRESIRHSSSQ